MIYHSQSKGAVEISTMASPWIANSLRKIINEILEVGLADPDNEDLKQLFAVRDAMVAELVGRGCSYDQTNARWIFPEQVKP